MARPRIIVTRKLPEPVEARLKSLFTVALNPSDVPFSKAKLTTAMAKADGLLCTFGDKIDADILAANGARKAKIIANFGVGTNHIDLETAEDIGVVVANTPGVLNDTTADLAMALILASTRRMFFHEARLRRGEWEGFDITSGLGSSLRGKTLGVIGMGRIGTALAQRAHFGFGMKVIYFNRSKVLVPSIPEAEAAETIDALMAAADVVSLHVPGDAHNRHLISAERLEMMKPDAHLINTARGDVVDEAALIAALESGSIAGAGLDVFEQEPTVPEALMALENVTLLPHIGSATLETRIAMGMRAVDNLVAFFAEQVPPHQVV
ncbi:MAG: D-glycerate dehydrogenase [Rhodobacteraceae bacterium]|nr:D-glycerate dehydrogenase [Paracoccaceae bacterium]